MTKIQNVGVRLRYATELEARGAADAAHNVLLAVSATMRVYMLPGGPIVLSRTDNPANSYAPQYHVTADFAVAPPQPGVGPGRQEVEKWPVMIERVTAPPRPGVTHIMLDLETFGRRPGCPVLTIGAVEFSPAGLGEEFYIGLDDKDQEAAGLAPDPETVAWWDGQSSAAKEAINLRTKTETGAALREFLAWAWALGPKKELRIWGNGADFDQPILAAVLDKFQVAQPWEFWNSRCYRTLKSMRSDIKFVKPLTPHHALEDAKAQAKHAVALLNELDLWHSV